MIHTKMHRLLASLHAYDVRTDSASREYAIAQIKAYTNKPHYILSDALVEALGAEEVYRTIDALVTAGVARMPVDECVVECEAEMVGNVPVRGFIFYRMTDVDWIEFYVAFLAPDGSSFGMPKGGTIRILPGTGGDKFEHYYETRGCDRTIGTLVARSLAMLIVLTHTRGVRKEVTTREHLAKLNKARVASKKSEVPAYTVFHIGHTYDASGNKSTWHPGSTMRPHLRAGHVRNQACGVKHKDHKFVFIKAVLVNCERAEDLKHVPKVIAI